MERLSEAICFTARAFDGVYRKAENIPSIFHSLEVAMIAQQMTEELEVVIAAVLHDTVEDAGVTLEEIETRFGRRVAELVSAETENKRLESPANETWQIRKEESIAVLRETADVGVKVLYLSDKLSNMRSLYRLRQKLGDDMWRFFHQKDPEAHHRYYQAVADVTREFRELSQWREYMDLIQKTFVEVRHDQDTF